MVAESDRLSRAVLNRLQRAMPVYAADALSNPRRVVLRSEMQLPCFGGSGDP
jgi:hypothetical protein